MKTELNNIYNYFFYLFKLVIELNNNGIKNYGLINELYNKIREVYENGNLKDVNEKFFSIILELDNIIGIDKNYTEFLSLYEDFLNGYLYIDLKGESEDTVEKYYLYCLFLIYYSVINTYDFEKYKSWREKLIAEIKKTSNEKIINLITTLESSLFTINRKLLDETITDIEVFVKNK